MNILDQTMKENKKEKKHKEEISKCFQCGSNNVENTTFMNGSRLAGQIKCNKCGALTMF